MHGALMVCGTMSDAGKSTVVAGLCRLLARQGMRVAPFKAQNMANNSWVTAEGHEIGRSTAAQALAAGIEPDVAMNPVLLKPTADGRAQLVLLGRPVDDLAAAEYQRTARSLLPQVLEALADLRSRHDVVVLEGAGGAAEINLLERDIVNLPLARAAGGIPAVVVGDIDRGGVFAALHGTVDLLPAELRRLVRGFVVNRMRGDVSLLGDGFAELERRCGVPTLGVLPFLDGLHLDAEDSLALDRPVSGAGVGRAGSLDVAVIRLPTVSNFTDLDPLVAEPQVGVQWVRDPSSLGHPDLIVIPGSKSTVADLGWLRSAGFEAVLRGCVEGGSTVLGICGGYQMLGRTIVDEVESGVGRVDGLGVLDAETVFGADKVTLRRSGSLDGVAVDGYQIHHGRVRTSTPWMQLDDRWGREGEGCRTDGWWGTTLHGLFEDDGARARLLGDVARRSGSSWTPSTLDYRGLRRETVDRVADAIEEHVDLDRLLDMVASAP